MIEWGKKLRVEFGAAFIWLVCLIYFTQLNPRSNNVLEVEEEPITSEKVVIVTLKLREYDPEKHPESDGFDLA
ncbi:hypothetical protein RJ640_004669 [Escallonia rubra]|uniref:Uncharacterized protein n=1 Tax=Escallonia rubra TaxID=112253 RepID=A0AA88R8T7_9ASTE|nr:hypothetical protein RJ640_004669 [Escallonia rubra]